MKNISLSSIWSITVIRYTVFFILLLTYTVIYAQPNTQNRILLNDGTLIYASKITVHKPKYESNYLFVNQQDSILFTEVSFYQLGNDFYLVKEMGDYGYVDMKRTVFGNISVFEFTEDLYDPGFGGGINKSTQTYYLKGQELKTLSNSNLRKDLKDSEASMQKLNYMRRRNLIRTGVFLGGLGLAAHGTAKMFEPDPINQNSKSFQLKFNPPFVVGVIAMVVAITTKRSLDYSLLDIIRDYNTEARENALKANEQ